MITRISNFFAGLGESNHVNPFKVAWRNFMDTPSEFSVIVPLFIIWGFAVPAAAVMGNDPTITFLNPYWGVPLIIGAILTILIWIKCDSGTW